MRATFALSAYIGHDNPSGCISDTGACGGETGDQCTNALDDDGDGSINGGCPSRAADANKVGESEGSQCSDSLDDDGDGFVNDGCYGFDTVLRLNTAANLITKKIKLGLRDFDATSFDPVSAVASPGGNRVYMLGARRLLSVIDTATDEVVQTIGGLAQSGNQTKSVALTSDGCHALVTSSPFVNVVDLATGDVDFVDDAALPFQLTSYDQVAASPAADHRAYVSMDGSDDAVLVVDTDTFTFVGNPITFSPDLQFAPEHLVVNSTGTKIYVGDRRSGRVAVVETATRTITKTIDTGSAPIGGLGPLVLSPDGARVYVSNYTTIYIIDTATDSLSPTTISTTAGGLNGLIFMAVSPDGRRLYATGEVDNGPKTIFVVDTGAATVVNRVSKPGQFPGPIVVAPARISAFACLTPTTTSTTVTGGSGQTTSTTLPGGTCATARDCLRQIQVGSLCAEAINPKLQGFISAKLGAAIGKLDKAAANAKKAAKLTGKARKLVQAIDSKAAKFATKKKDPISAECRASIRQALSPGLLRLDQNAI